MNRVLRSPEISEKSYVIPAKTVQREEVAEDDQDEGFRTYDADDSDSEGSLEDAEAETPPDEDEVKANPSEEASSEALADESGESEDRAGGTEDTPSAKKDGSELTEEVAERDESASASSADASAVASEASDDELPTPVTEIEEIVEARLKEFEERFQQEKEDAYHAGFEDGTNEGMKQGLNQSEEEVCRFQDLVESLTGQWKNTLKTYDTSVMDLAIRIAKKIIDTEIERNQDAVLQAVHECLSYVEDKTKVIIRVNSEDLEAVRRHRNDWLESLESIDHLLIEAEPSVTRGGCVVETPIGDVDAQIEERLERLRSALLEEINRTDDSQET